MTAIETRRSFTPAEVDEMELWLVAEMLGVNDAPGADSGGLLTREEFDARSAALIEERVRRAAAGEAPPEPPSAAMEATPDMIRALADRRRQREAAQQGA